MIDTAKMQSKREKLGLSQSEAAGLAGFTRQRWNDIESGRKDNVELATLYKIAEALRMKARDLLK